MTIKIHSTVKSEIISIFGQNELSSLLINLYEGVYNRACSEGFSLEEGHTIAMKSLENFASIVSNK
jgi:hypothetical protein